MEEARSRALTWLVAIAAAVFVLYQLRDVLMPFAAGFEPFFAIASAPYWHIPTP